MKIGFSISDNLECYVLFELIDYYTVNFILFSKLNRYFLEVKALYFFERDTPGKAVGKQSRERKLISCCLLLFGSKFT